MSVEVLAFLVAALLAGGLTMGGVTLVYFLDKWRPEPAKAAPSDGHGHRPSPFDRTG